MRVKVVLPWPASQESIDYVRSVVGLPEVVDVAGLPLEKLLQPSGDMASAIEILDHDSALLDLRKNKTGWIPKVVEVIRSAEKEGCKAAVIVCNGDPGLEEAREVVSIPVLGAGQVGMYVSSMLGHKFSIIVPSISIKRWLQENVYRYALHHKCASVRSINSSAMEAVKASKTPGLREAYLSKVAEECIKAVLEDDASVIMLGCGGMMWMGDDLQRHLGEKGYDIPVVNPVPTAVRIAITLAELGLRHSKDITWPYTNPSLAL